LEVSTDVKIAMQCFENFGGQMPPQLRAWSIVFSHVSCVIAHIMRQYFRSYGMDSEIPELHCHSHTEFCIGPNFETIISGEILGTPTQCLTFVIYDDPGQKTRLN